MDGWMDGWMDGLMDGWMDGSMDGGMDGWTKRTLCIIGDMLTITTRIILLICPNRSSATPPVNQGYCTCCLFLGTY